MARIVRASEIMAATRPSQSRDCPPFAQRLESQPWFKADRILDGETARHYLLAPRERSRTEPRPYCVYVHVPFCASICRYCALYTRAVRGRADAVLDEYLERVCQAVADHPQTHGGHGPTTVHFGGGTPLHLGLTRFATLTRALRETFGNPATCEWALETTTSALNPEVVAALADLGFQRIHLGIQTLDNRLRQHYRRHESGEAAIEKIHFLQQRGFHCSVDLIIGFADSNEAILRDDLRRLYDAGVRMFSLCELQQRQGRELTARRHQAQSQQNYRLWTIVWRFMERVGLRPIHLGQFARSQQDNRYYTHPARGEDCIAIGPYAHGSAGRLYYGNRLLPDYYAAIQAGASPIDRAVLYDDSLETLRDLERELLAHRVQPPTLERVASHYPTFAEILDFWQARQLLLPSEGRSAWTTTQEGSWFVGNMIAQARQLAEPGADVPRPAPRRPTTAQSSGGSPVTRTAFLLPVLDRWLWYAPLHGAAALLNRSAARLLRERRDQHLPGELGELCDWIHAAPAHPPRPLEGELIPTLLGIVPTRGCNMNCLYCNFGGPAARRDVMPPELATAAVDWAAGQRAKAGESTFPVQFFGGEPFLAQDLVEIVVHRARSVSSQHGLTPWFDASTNGLFNERQRRFIGDYFDGVVLSLDGPPAFQDHYRPVANGRPSSATVERNARALSEMPLELCLRMCVTQESVNEMERIARWMIESFNPATINFETLTPGELTRQAGLAPPDPYQFAVQTERVFQLAEATSVKAVYAAAETGVPRLSFCPVGKDVVIVSPDGRLSACYLPPEEWRQRGLNLDIGQLRPDRGATLFPDALVKVRRLAADKPRCEHCFCQYTCAGGCHVNPPGGGDRKYADFCIQTRLITAGRLLRDLGFAAVHGELLGDRSAMERLAQNPDDSLNDAADGG